MKANDIHTGISDCVHCDKDKYCCLRRLIDSFLPCGELTYPQDINAFHIVKHNKVVAPSRWETERERESERERERPLCSHRCAEIILFFFQLTGPKEHCSLSNKHDDLLLTELTLLTGCRTTEAADPASRGKRDLERHQPTRPGAHPAPASWVFGFPWWRFR